MGALLCAAAAASTARADSIHVVAAESVYGDIARQIGAPQVAVTSILNNPAQDPHEFEASPSTARHVADARLFLYNGADYDPWAPRLLAASRRESREVICVAELLHKKAGDNPHLWYDPAAAPALARALAESLGRIDPAHQRDYQGRREEFERSLQPLADQIAALRARYAGTPVTATEPLFGYMAQALGLRMRNERFQLAVMNDTEPSASAIAAMEQDLRYRKVRVLLFNSQASSPLARRVREIARQAGVPVVTVTETLPTGMTYQEWMLSQLSVLE
ncbi:MAG TPA: zinc ABC transporter substrate-binding protein, partial [bacterium]|nr:zinc ABC transporter substrate-binding protein [bacterium]